MKKRHLVIILNLLIALLLKGQDIDQGQLYGSWYGEITGDPGRNIQQNDSSFLSVPPLTYSKTTLKLMRHGRAKKSFKNLQNFELGTELKGKWKLMGDTLILQFGTEKEIFLIDQSMKDRIFLKSVNSDRIIFGRIE